jgi:hypothetical protein
LTAPFRIYYPHELGSDGYPFEWHLSIKHIVREEAEHRCIRCGHPYRIREHGSGEWSPCDERCSHDGPAQYASSGVGIMPLVATGPIVARGRGVLARWRILTVHHLDGDKANCRWWNLLALCQRCHLIIQGRVKPAQIYVFEHSEWFKPYAAGYYALTYLGEDLTREQTMERLDELLALERVS